MVRQEPAARRRALKRPVRGSALESGGLLLRDAAWSSGGVPEELPGPPRCAGGGSRVWGSELRRKAASVKAGGEVLPVVGPGA